MTANVDTVAYFNVDDRILLTHDRLLHTMTIKGGTAGGNMAKHFRFVVQRIS